METTIFSAENIPVRYINEDIRQKLSVLLDPPIGKCYKNLAEILLNYDSMEIIALDCRKPAYHSSTKLVLEEYQCLASNSVGAIRAALVKMKRDDAVSILEERSDEMVKDFGKKNQNGWHTRQDAKVFVTYAENDTRHALDIARELSGTTSRIMLDNNKSPSMNVDRVTWVNRCVRNADFIVMCVSQQYNQRLKLDLDPARASLNTCHVYKMLSAERDGERHRIIAVRLDDDDVRLNLLNGITIYKWPVDKAAIANKLRVVCAATVGVSLFA